MSDAVLQFLKDNKVRCNYNAFIADTKALIEGHRCVMLNDHFVMKEQVMVDFLQRFEHLSILEFFDGLKFLVHIRLLQKKLERDLENEFSCYRFVDVSATLSKPKLLNSTETHELLQVFKPLCMEISQALSEGKRRFEPLTVMYDNMIPTVCGYLLDMPWIYCTKTQNNSLSNCLLRKIDILDSENGNFICGYTVPEELFDQHHHDKLLNRLKALLNVSSFKEIIQMISRPILLL
ncbi:hypothetical protein MP638_007536 [Amoeboaphelidium occidentale]|nr:hypothetical protein MP638_007536 [Amoeboaphelidium occidentale]